MIDFKKIQWYLLAFSVVIILDRFTKSWMVQSPGPHCVNNIVSFCLSVNRGVAWSLFSSESTFVFVHVSLLIALFIGVLSVYTIIRYLNHYSVMGEVLVLAGALSNMLDRFLYSGVIDFIVFSINGWAWPTFNIADSAIVLGVLIMFIQGYRE